VAEFLLRGRIRFAPFHKSAVFEPSILESARDVRKKKNRDCADKYRSKRGSELPIACVPWGVRVSSRLAGARVCS